MSIVNAKPAGMQQQNTAVPPPSTLGQFSFLDFVVITAENLKLLFIVASAVGLLSFGVVLFLPKTYTSVTILALSSNEARAAEDLILSVVLDTVAVNFPDSDGARSPIEAHRRDLRKRVALEAMGTDKKNATLYALSVNQTDSQRAQNINLALVSTWLEMSKPRPFERARLEERLKTYESELKSASDALEKFKNDIDAVRSPNPNLTSITGLFDYRTKLIADIASIKAALAGKNNDVVFVHATRPTEAFSRRREFLIAAGLTIVALVMTWLFACLREARRRLGPEDPAAKKWDRAKDALSIRRTS